jgi:hypothetical protein
MIPPFGPLHEACAKAWEARRTTIAGTDQKKRKGNPTSKEWNPSRLQSMFGIHQIFVVEMAAGWPTVSQFSSAELGRRWLSIGGWTPVGGL